MTTKLISIGWSSGVGPSSTSGASDAGWCSPAYYAEIARMLERAGVDFLTFAEAAHGTLNSVIVASAISGRTGRLGIVPAMSPQDYPPFKLARLLATLVHVTGGRIGWSIDMGQDRPDAYRFGQDAPPQPAPSAEIVEEYVSVIRKLWDSWAPDSLVQDPESGTFADPAKVRAIDHAGRHFQVRGPLNTTTAPYGRPLVLQAVQSDEGLDFAARHADLVVLRGTTADEVAARRQRLNAIAADAKRAAPRSYVEVTLRVGETQGGREAWPEGAPGALVIEGARDEVAAGIESAFDSTGCDGVVIAGDWDPARTTIVCSDVLALLRRRGRIAPAARQTSLLDRLTG